MESEPVLAARAALLTAAAATGSTLDVPRFAWSGSVLSLDQAALRLAQDPNGIVAIEIPGATAGIVQLETWPQTGVRRSPLHTFDALLHRLSGRDICFRAGPIRLRLSPQVWTMFVEKYDILFPFIITADPASQAELAEGFGVKVTIGESAQVVRSLDNIDLPDAVRSGLEAELKRRSRDQPETD